MTVPVLADALGPRGRRRVLIVSAFAAVAVAALLYLIVRRLQSTGQLDAAKWEQFKDPLIIKFYLQGLATTMRVALAAMALATLIGGVMALGRLALSRPVRWLAGTYVEFFRAVPLLLLIYFFALGLPKYGVDFSTFWFLVMGLVVYNSAVLAEIFRAGILSLERGQTEAALAIGLTYWQTMLIVVIPQALRRMVPSIVSQLVTLLKDSSLGFAIAYEELLRRARINGTFYGNPLQSFLVAALLYFVVNFALSRVARRLEVRQRRRYRAGPVQVAGAGEDLVMTDVSAETKAPTARNLDK